MYETVADLLLCAGEKANTIFKYIIKYCIDINSNVFDISYLLFSEFSFSLFQLIYHSYLRELFFSLIIWDEFLKSIFFFFIRKFKAFIVLSSLYYCTAIAVPSVNNKFINAIHLYVHHGSRKIISHVLILKTST